MSFIDISKVTTFWKGVFRGGCPMAAEGGRRTLRFYVYAELVADPAYDVGRKDYHARTKT
jgi:Trk-type K+ transport system membrane component